ncbi:MAG: arylsulfatase A-like enzyme [Myxococcota bacterium]|jgi:arylsulfatase A-like enzyme
MLTIALLLLACGSDPAKDADSGPPAVSTTDPTTPTGTPTGTTPTGPTGPAGMLQFDGPAPTNILWVSIDTLRHDVWARYGGEDVMPFLDEKMAEGFVLDDVHQCSNWTGAGTSCTMSGRHGIDDGFEPLLSANNGVDFVPDETVFFAEILRDRGYRTELLTTNGWLGAEWGNTQGFDTERGLGGWKAGPVFDEALTDLLSGPTDEPWFFHVHLFDPHAPYDPPEEYLGELEGRSRLPWDLSSRTEHYAIADDRLSLSPDLQAELETQLRIRYKAEITYMDDMIDDIWPVFDAAGLLDDTLVVFWADHGESFWEHEHQTHAWDLYDEENQVAMFFWAKNLAPGAYAGPVSTIDLVPTLLELYDIEAPPTMTGIPIDDIELGRVRYSMSNARAGIVQSVTRGTQRIQFYWRDGLVVVTDAATDPAETINLYGPADPLTLEMWDLLLPRVLQAEAALDTTRWPLTWPPELPR